MDVKIRILQWEKFNPRKDYKRPWWFALSNRLIDDPDFGSFSAEEFKAWIYILSMASRDASDTILVRYDHAQRIALVKKRALISAIEKLEKIRAIEKICTDSVQDLYSTEQNRTLQNRTNTHAQSFDFAEIYNLFPKKIGKQQGFEICKRTIKTLEDFQALKNAVTKYREYIIRSGLEARYIKHFSTFMKSWRDWEDPETGSSAIGYTPPNLDDIFTEEKR